MSVVLVKTWVGVTQTNASTTAGNISQDDNWGLISLKNPLFTWTASGSGTNEFYLVESGSGNPTGVYSNFVEPAKVNEDIAGTATNMAAGTAGSLTAGQWDWADNDTLGYSTIYVRTTDSVDPDTLDDNHITMCDIPATSDHVRIPASSTTAISTGLDQGGVAIGDFIVERGYTKTIGTAGGGKNSYLIIDPNRFEFAGGGESYINIGTANINAEVTETKTPAKGKRGLYLLGSNIATAVITGGHVGIATLPGEVSTVATARVSDGSLWLSSGVTLTTFAQTGGSNVIRCSATTVSNYDGDLTTWETGTITTLNADGGTTFPNSTGTITTCNMNGGDVNTIGSHEPRTITNLKQNDGTLFYDNDVLTLTNRTAPDYPIELAASRL